MTSPTGGFSGHDSEPAEGVGAFEGSDERCRNAPARDAVKPVAAGDEIAGERAGLSVLLVNHLWRGPGDVLEADALRLIDDQSAVALAHAVELLGDRCLTVRNHRLAAMRSGVHQEGLAILPRDPAAVVDVAFPVHPLPDAGVAQKLDRAVFQDAGANSLQDMRLGLPLEHDAVDAAEMQHVGQEEARRPPADDRNLGALLHET